MAYDPAILISELTADEGWCNFPYTDSEGNVGVGCGRNLSANGLSDDEIALLLNNDIVTAEAGLDADMHWWRRLDDVRQLVMINMAFNMGITRLLGFKHFLAAVETQEWSTAAEQMLNSLWATQVGDRAARLAAMMRTGQLPPGTACDC